MTCSTAQVYQQTVVILQTMLRFGLSQGWYECHELRGAYNKWWWRRLSRSARLDSVWASSGVVVTKAVQCKCAVRCLQSSRPGGGLARLPSALCEALFVLVSEQQEEYTHCSNHPYIRTRISEMCVSSGHACLVYKVYVHTY